MLWQRYARVRGHVLFLIFPPAKGHMLAHGSVTTPCDLM